MKTTVLIRLKEDVPDAPGAAVKDRLYRMGFTEVKRARVGKLVEIEFGQTDRDTAAQKLKKICEDLLCNPATEEYEILKFE